MKPSHRKDVIIARIIFAFICLALIAVITIVVIAISSHHKSTVKDTESSQTESESDVDYADESLFDNDEVEDIELNTEASVEVTVKTTSGVRLRMEPSLEASIITVVPEGTELLLVAEKEGWAEVIYDGQTGYISTEFIVEVAATGDAATSDGTDNETGDGATGQDTTGSGDEAATGDESTGDSTNDGI